MSEDEVRRAYLRLADPFGTRPRGALLGVSLALVAAFSWFRVEGVYHLVIPCLTALAAGVYGLVSLRVRRTARESGAMDLRARLVEGGRRRLKGAAALPVRGAMWLAVGAWAWISLTGAVPFLLFESVDGRLFLGGAGLLFAARYFLEWGVDVPRLRADLAALGAPPSPPPV